MLLHEFISNVSLFSHYRSYCSDHVRQFDFGEYLRGDTFLILLDEILLLDGRTRNPLPAKSLPVYKMWRWVGVLLICIEKLIFFLILLSSDVFLWTYFTNPILSF